MPHSHRLAATTRTVELQQLDEINRLLADPDRVGITAEMLGLGGSPIPGPRFPEAGLVGLDPVNRLALAPTALLRRISASGLPDFPYLTGHFQNWGTLETADHPRLVVTLHTDSLDRLSGRLRLQHCWGAF